MSVQKRNGQNQARVLIVDDEFHVARGAAMVLSQAGYECETCPTVEAALKLLDNKGADVIIADMRMTGMDGMDLLKKVQSKDPDMAVLVSVPLPAAESAKAALRGGAFDCVTKPFDSDELNAVVSRAVEMSALQRENRKLREQLDVASIAAGFVAEAPKSRQLVAMIRRVAPSRTTALIEGETGTGKELVARMLHYWSNRADGPFLAINCKALADGVVESELFGHEKGSFTGAIRDRAGCFERASGGTLFLDEIGEAGPDFQAKLLRVLEDGEVLRVGGSKPRKVDVRIITATNRKLRNEVAAGRFRADLYFRLSVIPLRIAPLRERREDILPLAHHFLAFHSTEAGRPLMLSPEAEAALLAHRWPGNVRELENVIERAVVMSGQETLMPEAFAFDDDASDEDLVQVAGIARAAGVDSSLGTATAPASADSNHAQSNAQPADSQDDGTLQASLDRAATVRIKAALATAAGNRVDAAAALGVDRTTLYRLMKRLSL
ncbi:MAG: sigma-54 dependent transcriptional regulator [Candidatus Binatus sp.]|jgi:two-component system NtrC family response regulator|uniref:sigma-54-dependent transcriptional regulator n=1 Tax=Candidatus Binatus sp. TaxID=2811406 RepID=UPI003C75E406